MANPAGESNAKVLRLAPPADAPVSRIGGHLRRRLGHVPGTRRRARPYHDGRRYTRRRTHRQERPACCRRNVATVCVRVRHDPAMRWIVGGKAALGAAASPSQMGRFETRWLTAEKNLSALAGLSGQWIDTVDAGFANPEVYEYLEAEGIKYAIRLPANRVLQERSDICSNTPMAVRRMMCAGPMRASPIRLEAGRDRAG